MRRCACTWNSVLPPIDATACTPRRPRARHASALVIRSRFARRRETPGAWWNWSASPGICGTRSGGSPGTRPARSS